MMVTMAVAAVAVGGLPAVSAEQRPLMPSKVVREFKQTARVPNRVGWLRTEYVFDMGNGTTIKYLAYVDPKTRMPINQGYGDVMFQYRGPGPYNWGPWHWLRVDVTDLKKPAAEIIYRQRLHAAHFLPGPERTVAEFVWEVPRPHATDKATQAFDRLCLRLISRRADRRLWVDLRLATEGKPRPVQVVFTCYPYSTTGQGWQQRVRWAATPSGPFTLHRTESHRLDPAKDWALFFFNRQTQTTGNCQFVYLPEQIAGADVVGTFSVRTALRAAPGKRRLQFVFDEQYGKPAEARMKPFLDAAGVWQQELRAVDWSLRGAVTARYRRLRSFLDELLAGPQTKAKFGKQVSDIYPRVTQHLDGPVGQQRAGVWKAVNLLDQLDRLKRPMTEYHMLHDMCQP